LIRNGLADEVPGTLSQPPAPKSPRFFTRLYPRDPLAWVELALYQVALGHADAADRSMRTALGLAPHNRHVLRSAARLLLHRNAPDEAHTLIARSPVTKSDPWLLASEISLAEVAHRSPLFYKIASRMLDDGSSSPRQLTELAGAVATEELLNGSRKKSRRAFSQSMLDPTGSALAQGEWATMQLGAEFAPMSRLESTPEASEALAFHFHRLGRYRDVAAFCWEWGQSDLFSIRPYEFGSSAAGLAEDYEAALELAKRGLKLRPKSMGLLNSMVFSLGSLGRVEEAQDYLDKIFIQETHPLYQLTLANRGLIAFRSGDEPQGRIHYKRAIEGFAKIGRLDLSAKARVYLAREALIARSPEAGTLLIQAREAMKPFAKTEANFTLRRVEALSEGKPLPDRGESPAGIVPVATPDVILTLPSGEERRIPIKRV
jgi:Tfp pilus assembly protein PilF